MFLLQTANEPANLEAAKEMLDFFKKMGGRLVIDILSMFILLRFIYFRIYKQGELFFTYIIFNLIIFFMCFFLNKVDLSMGAAFGLFAVFGMLRYRTEDISIKDMTYLFLVIAMGLIGAVLKLDKIKYYYEWLVIVAVNGFILLLTWLMESSILMRRELTKTIYYEKIELVKAERHAEMLEDLRNRTGLDIHRYSIQRVDFLRDMAIIKIYYNEKSLMR